MKNYTNTNQTAEQSHGYLLEAKIWGEQSGKLKKAKQVVRNLLMQTNMSKEEIAKLVDIPLDIVEQSAITRIILKR